MDERKFVRMISYPMLSLPPPQTWKLKSVLCIGPSNLVQPPVRALTRRRTFALINQSVLIYITIIIMIVLSSLVSKGVFQRGVVNAKYRLHRNVAADRYI